VLEYALQVLPKVAAEDELNIFPWENRRVLRNCFAENGESCKNTD